MILSADTSLTAIDVIILIVLAVGLIEGLRKGMIRQAFGLGGLVSGLILGALFSKPATVFLLDSIKMSEKAAGIVAFIIILMVVPAVFVAVGNILFRLVKAVQLGFADRLLGGVFGLLKYLIFTGLVIQLLEMSGLAEKFINRNEEHPSLLYEPVRKTTDFCLHWTWDHIEEQTGLDLPELYGKDKDEK